MFSPWAQLLSYKIRPLFVATTHFQVTQIKQSDLFLLLNAPQGSILVFKEL